MAEKIFDNINFMDVIGIEKTDKLTITILYNYSSLIYSFNTPDECEKQFKILKQKYKEGRTVYVKH